MTDKVQIKVNITGRVQGVFYRASTKEAALRIGIKGYVKNLADSSVEAVFEGDAQAVSQILEWCGNGPPGAVVGNVFSEKTEGLSNYTDFEIRY
ncbi:MAG: acylphosphatase [Desulfobacteraceae bacterium]|nr:acylphosphatase [Desulfobacteraceae bacterium]